MENKKNKVLVNFNNIQITGVCWFTSFNSCVGVVRILDKYEGFKYYIAATSGNSEVEDIKFIASYGAPFYKKSAELLDFNEVG